MKRKLLVLLLAVMTAVCVMGCGGDSGKETGKSENSATNEEDDADDADDAKDNDAEDEQSGDTDSSSSNTNYATYDDFTIYDNIFTTDIYFNYPYWREEKFVNGQTLSRDVNDFYIIIAFDYESPYSGELENILEKTYPGFAEIAWEQELVKRDVNASDILTMTTEKVTFDNGIEAIKFEGLHPGREERFGPFPVYGYSFVYENVDFTIGYILDEDTTELREEYEEELQDVVYRIITTLRIGKE